MSPLWFLTRHGQRQTLQVLLPYRELPHREGPSGYEERLFSEYGKAICPISAAASSSSFPTERSTGIISLDTKEM